MSVNQVFLISWENVSYTMAINTGEGNHDGAD